MKDLDCEGEGAKLASMRMSINYLPHSCIDRSYWQCMHNTHHMYIHTIAIIIFYDVVLHYKYAIMHVQDHRKGGLLLVLQLQNHLDYVSDLKALPLSS